MCEIMEKYWIHIRQLVDPGSTYNWRDSSGG
jgi:hypothetical protein